MAKDTRQFDTEHAELAINLIAEQIGNIEAAIWTLDEALTKTQSDNLHQLLFVQIFRMCLSWLILTTAKVEELWREYGSLAEPYSRDRMRAALREVSERGMTDLRNASVAHILDKKTRKPLSPSFVEESIKTMFRGNPLEFFHWLRHPDDPKVDTLSRALRVFREDLIKKYPNARITMPVSTYATSSGDVQF